MSTSTKISSKPIKSGWSHHIANFIIILLSVGLAVLFLYFLGCAMNMFPDTKDKMCKSIQQIFKSGADTLKYGTPCTREGKTGLYGTDGSCYTCSEGTAVINPTENCSNPSAGVYCCGGGAPSGGENTQVSTGCQHCSSGFCWTGRTCCPKSAPYECNGYCYRTSNDASSASHGQCTSFKFWCCQ